jgi:hypothetical protein
MAAMHVIEETPTKIILEMNNSQSRDSSGRGLGCSGIVFGITLVLVILVTVFGYLYHNTPRSSLFWGVTFGSLLMETLVIYAAIFVSRVLNTVVEKAAVNIDLHSYRAVRIEKLRSGQLHYYELKLEDVSRILVCQEEPGQSCRVLLDTKNGSHLEVNSDEIVGMESVESMKLFASRLAELLKKPVVLKGANWSNTRSVEPIQIEYK